MTDLLHILAGVLLVISGCRIWYLSSRVRKLEQDLSDAGLLKSVPDIPRVPPPPIPTRANSR